MKLKSRIKVASLLLALLVILPSLASATVVIDSQDWKDVYSGVLYAHSQGEKPYFVNSPDASGLFKILPKGEEVTVLKSSDEPHVSNIGSQLEARGYEVGEVRELERMNFELIPSDVESFVVVEGGFPSASLPAGSLAQQRGGWPIVVNDQNIDQVADILSQAEGEVILAGTFKRQLRNAIQQYADKTIRSPNKFNLSVELAKEFLEEKDTSRVIISGGRYIEREVLKGEHPVLLSGTNFLPNPVERFLMNEENGIDSAVMIGNQLTTVGESIRDKSNENIGVFVKYGQARGRSKIYALSQFPLPGQNISLSVESANYDPDKNQLVVTFENPSGSNIYELTSFSVVSGSGEELASGGDEDPVFVGAGETRSVSYNVDIPVNQLSGPEIELTTSYGENPSSLDTYITNTGQFNPPYVMDLNVSEIEDESQVALENLVYLPGYDRFRATVKNNGSVTSYVDLTLRGVSVQGEETSVSSDTEEVGPGETEQIYLSLELDEIDLQENEEVDVAMYYGEEEDLKVHSKGRSVDFVVEETSLTGMLVSTTGAGIATALIVIIVVAVIYYRKRD